MISISRPAHKKYVLKSVSYETYIKFINGYSTSKKLGVKGVWIYVSGSGVYELCKEAIHGEVRRWGRRRLASGILAGASYICAPVVPLITNSTKIVRVANTTHTCISYVAETCEDITNMAWLPLDLLLCGQPIPIGEAGRYNLMNGDDSLFPDLLDSK